MKGLVLVAGIAIVLSACAIGHLRKEIQPPGGCDQCHRQRIASGWELSLAPARLGREGGIPEDRDVWLRELLSAPVHRRVPARRLELYAAAAPVERPEDSEKGIQCFVCHKSPSPPHEILRGTFPHPWGKRAEP
jgi:hypothetical protein